jgi:hypothetical protein
MCLPIFIGPDEQTGTRRYDFTGVWGNCHIEALEFGVGADANMPSISA